MEPVLAHPGRQSFTVVAADGSISFACIHSWRFSAIALVQQQKVSVEQLIKSVPATINDEGLLSVYHTG